MNTTLADIATGNTGGADVLFLIGAILAVVAALVAVPVRTAYAAWATFFGALAVGCVSFGLMLL